MALARAFGQCLSFFDGFVALARWEGSLKEGRGTMKPANAGEAAFGLGSRFEGQKGSNPEELIGAALAGLFN